MTVVGVGREGMPPPDTCEDYELAAYVTVSVAAANCGTKQRWTFPSLGFCPLTGFPTTRLATA
jgi:hypothetical protein